MRFHHVGIAVGEIASVAAWWKDVFGFRELTPVVHDPGRKLRSQLLESEGGERAPWRGLDRDPPGVMRIELAEPTEADSSLHRHIGSSTGGIYHVCFEVDDLEGTVLDWRRRGAFPVTKPAAAAIFDGRRTVFMRTPDRLLTELVEAPASEAA